MSSSEKVKAFAVSIIKIAEREGLSEEEFTSAIDMARKVIRRNPITSKCLDNVRFEPNALFQEIDIVEIIKTPRSVPTYRTGQ